MRILLLIKGKNFVTSIMQAYKRAFEKLEVKTELIDILECKGNEFVNRVRRFEPQFVLAYGMIGFFKTQDTGAFFRHLKITLINLVLDNPFLMMNDFIENELRNYPEYYYSFIFDDVFLKLYREKGYVNGYKIMNAVDETTFKPTKQVVGERKRALCFVGHTRVEYLNMKYDKPIVDQLIDDIINIKICNIGVPLNEVIEYIWNQNDKYRAYKAFFMQNEKSLWDIIYKTVHLKGSEQYRKYVLMCIDDEEVYLYGDSQLEKTNLHVMPAVPYGEALSKVYSSYAINLNLSSLQLETSLNNRVFDSLASGGFILNDYKSDLEKIFPDYYEYISFKTIDKLREKAAYYLAHEKEREEILKELMCIVRQEHTYEKRASYILNIIKK